MLRCIKHITDCTLCSLPATVEEAKRSQYFITLEDTGRNVILPQNVTEFMEMLTLVYWQPPKVIPRRVLQAFLDIQLPKYKGFEDGEWKCVRVHVHITDDTTVVYIPFCVHYTYISFTLNWFG